MPPNGYGSITLPNEVLDRIDEYADTHGYSSRSDAITNALDESPEVATKEDMARIMDSLESRGDTQTGSCDVDSREIASSVANDLLAQLPNRIAEELR